MIIFRLYYLLVLVLLMSSNAICLSGFRITDDLGREVKLPGPPERIISLAPAITELLFEILPPERIVGVSKFSNFPPEVVSKPRVGTYIRPVFEKILSLKPDLIIGTAGGLTQELATQFERLHLPLYVIYPRKLSNIPTLCLKLSRVLGVAEKGKLLSRNLYEAIKNYSLRSRPLSPVKVLYMIDHDPLMGVGYNTFIGDMLKLGNFSNVLASDKKRFPVIPLERLILMNPDIIILAAFEPTASLKFLMRYKIIEAVKRERIYTVNPDIFNRPGPRIITAMARLLEIHRDATHRESATTAGTNKNSPKGKTRGIDTAGKK